jgi:hypothetical protein
MPGIKTIWVLTGMTLKIIDKPLTLAMKIMVLTGPTSPYQLDNHINPREGCSSLSWYLSHSCPLDML